jgi:1,4-alpha-glucan branching enzyme
MTEKGTVPDADDEVPHLSAEEAEAIASGTHGNPFSVLGVQETLGGFLARTFIPGASEVQALTLDGRTCRQVGRRPGASRSFRRQASHHFCAAAFALHGVKHGQRLDRHLDGRRPLPTGPCSDRWTTTCLPKARICACSTRWARIRSAMKGTKGVHFAVWAPNARRVSVVGDFNDWDGRRHVMRLQERCRGLGDFRARSEAAGAAYKYEIIGARRAKNCLSRPTRMPDAPNSDRPPPRS